MKWTIKDIERLKREGVLKGVKVPAVQPSMFHDKKARKKKSIEEYRLQVACVKHFDLVYPELIPLAFHIPNQAVIDSGKIGQYLKNMGRRRGPWDFKLQVPRDEFWGLYIEFKVEDGTLSEEQKQFRNLSKELGCNYKWIIIRDRMQFVLEIEAYLKTGRVNI